MPKITKDKLHEEMTKAVFLSLLERWDVKDKSLAVKLAKVSVEVADGFAEVYRSTYRPSGRN